MKKSVSEHITFRQEKGTASFTKSLGDEHYTIQDVVAHIVKCIEDIASTPGKNMHIMLHVSKDIGEGE